MLQTGRVVVEIAPPSTVVSAEAPLPSTMPPIGMTQVLADVIAVADPDSGAFGFPRLRVAVRSTDASRLAVFLALPDGSAAVLPFEAAGDGGTFEIRARGSSCSSSRRRMTRRSLRARSLCRASRVPVSARARSCP